MKWSGDGAGTRENENGVIRKMGLFSCFVGHILIFRLRLSGRSAKMQYFFTVLGILYIAKYTL